MRRMLLAGMIAFAAPAYAEDVSKDGDVHTCYQSLPDAMLGSWTMGDEEGIMERADKDHGDFLVEKDKYYTVDDVCTILHIEKLGNSYMVQARCDYEGDDPLIPGKIYDSGFEMKGDRLRVTPATGS